MNSANISKNDIVYEIGIGKGILTPFLCEKSKNVISVEKDVKLYEESKGRRKKRFSRRIQRGCINLQRAKSIYALMQRTAHIRP